MSRVGKKPILIPEGVSLKIEDELVEIKGPKGSLEVKLPYGFQLLKKDQSISIIPSSNTPLSKSNRALWGLTRSLLANSIKGVQEGYQKKLEIEGVGFRAGIEQGQLVLQVGFSHPIKISPPEGIQFEVEKNIITISGIDKEKVTNTAAMIRALRKPEPYKGKGIRYLGEVIRRKTGKKAATVI